jgi:hypothetical protein
MPMATGVASSAAGPPLPPNATHVLASANNGIT